MTRREAGRFGESFVRNRLNGRTNGIAMDLERTYAADLVYLPPAGVRPVILEVKAQLEKPVTVRLSDDEDALRLLAKRRGLAWALVRVVYRKNGSHQRGKPRLVAVWSDVFLEANGTPEHEYKPMVDALDCPSN